MSSPEAKRDAKRDAERDAARDAARDAELEAKLARVRRERRALRVLAFRVRAEALLDTALEFGGSLAEGMLRRFFNAAATTCGVGFGLFWGLKLFDFVYKTCK